jgi:hypothetical protein
VAFGGRCGLWWEWPDKRAYGGGGLIREVAFGGNGLIREVAFGGSGLIRGVAFDGGGLIRGPMVGVA